MKINKWLSKSQDDDVEIDDKIPCVQQEFETQSMTLDFGDDLVSLKSFKYNDSKFLPKSEARVYVNNPEIFEYPNTKPLSEITTPRDNFLSRKIASSDIQSDYNDSNTEEYDLPSPIKLSYTNDNASRSPRVSSFRKTAQVPPPPPPPPAPILSADTSLKPSVGGIIPPPPPFPLNLNQPKDGLLKFQKTKEISSQPLKANNETTSKQVKKEPANELQRELEKKLVKIRESLYQELEEPTATSNERHDRKYSTIHHFDPEYISSPKEVNFKNMSENYSQAFSDKENTSDNNKKNTFNFNPRETFTSKAKEALEKYKIAKGTSSSSQSDHSEYSSIDSRSVVRSHNKKHAPFPFKTNQPQLK